MIIHVYPIYYPTLSCYTTMVAFPTKRTDFPRHPVTELATSWPSGRGGAKVAQLGASDPVCLPAVGKTMP